MSAFGTLQAPATMGATRKSLEEPFLLLVTSQPVAVPFSNLLPPSCSCSRNWEQLGTNRQFYGERGLAFCFRRSVCVDLTFRHSAASTLNERTGNLKLAQKLLGRSNIDMTAETRTPGIASNA